MKQKKIPMRKCVGCGEMFPKKELIRVVKAPDIKDSEGNITGSGDITVDKTGKKAGRGAYICNNKDCLRAAKKARRLERAFSCKIPEEIYIAMENELD